jgi:hypothetical protein
MEGKKYGGRQKGTSNKLSIENREKIKEFIDRDIDDFFNEFQGLEVPEKMNVRKWIYALGIPKEKDVNLTMSEKRPLGGAMGDLSRMTMEQQIKARPDLFQMLIDKAKAIQEVNDAENVP